MNSIKLSNAAKEWMQKTTISKLEAQFYKTHGEQNDKIGAVLKLLYEMQRSEEFTSDVPVEVEA